MKKGYYKKRHLFLKVFLLISFMFLCCENVFAQQNSTGLKISKTNLQTVKSTGFVRCASVEYENKLSEEDPSRASETEFESWMSTKLSQAKASRINGKVAVENEYTIPVVIHIVHNGDEVNTFGNAEGENISDAQAASQIEVLNQDFRRMIGTPGGQNSTGLAVDIKINFCLAQQDPSGLETTGIIRHEITPYSDDVPNPGGGGLNDGGSDWETYNDVQRMKRETQWDPTKYLNIWTIRTGGKSVEDGGLDDLLGVAQFPSNSGLQGLGDYGGSADTDGVVISFHAFGDSKNNDGSFIMNNVYNEGRTTTHEVGHWLGLRHIWGDPDDGVDGCTVDDFCLDTPNSNDANTSCRILNSCPFDGGVDMVQNYMDYTADPCMDTFTQDQKDRMRVVMENSPRRVELINSTGCEPPIYSNKDLEELIVNPNPVTDELNIVGSANGTVKLSVYDINGKLMLSEKYYDVETIFSEKLNLDHISAGIYLVFVENEDKKIVKRIIKN